MTAPVLTIEELIRRDKVRAGVHPHRDQDVVFSYRPPKEVVR